MNALPISATVLLALTAALLPAATLAGPAAYDLNVLLDRPYPLDSGPPPPSEAGAPLYESQIRAPARFPQSAPEGVAVPRPAVEPSLMDRMGQTAAAPPEAPRTDDPAFITVGAGYYDFNDNEEAGEFRVEYRGEKLYWLIKPLGGIMGTSDGAVYGYGGITFDLYFGRRLVISPSFAPGLYFKGSGKDLGSVIEFRSGIEVGWRFDDRSRLSAMVYHISNAHITDQNPGTEIFSIGYSFPLYW